ncbi:MULTISPECIES: CHAT domain-containing protein [Catenuloplanes]|uniref:Uncharacterized protein n=1 Tax=Catenuloplanes niger TaxID=587534 RepID=A0AAE4CZY1_9ACTN|nr:CHAT domain-containing protein [Catenuloplanes niger]MDR7327374.1 hypothetical protein [Catenuloplanes niger]
MTEPPVVTITEQSRSGDTFHATVEFTGDPYRHAVTVRDPADRAPAAYGTSLFGQVFTGRALRRYARLGDGRLVVSGTAAFHRLHWEMMRDPRDDHPLSVRMRFERRTHQEAEYAPLPPGPSLAVLVVAARPFGSGPPTVSRTLVTAAWDASPPLRVGLSRPGTWRALHEHLADGRYEAVHADLAGVVLDWAGLQAEIDAGRFSPSLPIPPYRGEQGFLLFETRADDVADPVPVADVARLLRDNRLAVAVLTLPGSGGDLAQRLAAAGVPVVVGMTAPSAPDTAGRMITDLYRGLAAGDTPGEAVRRTRQRLDPARDWRLPVLYQQRDVTITLAELSESERAAFHESLTRGGPEPAEVRGRDADVLAVERRLFFRGAPNELVLHGPAGAGKTWLLRLLAWWWQRTGPVSRVFRFSLDEPDVTPRTMVEWIASGLATAEGAATAEMAWPALLGGVVRRLRDDRHLLILDCGGYSLRDLDDDGEETYRAVLTRLRGGRTLVLIGSRSDEPWLPTPTVARYRVSPPVAAAGAPSGTAARPHRRVRAALAGGALVLLLAGTGLLANLVDPRGSAGPAGLPTTGPAGITPTGSAWSTPTGSAGGASGEPARPAVTVDPQWADGAVQAPGVRITAPSPGAGVEACMQVSGTADGLAPNETIVVAIRRADRFTGEPFFLHRVVGWDEPVPPATWTARVSTGNAIWQEFDVIALVGDRERIRAAWPASRNMTSATEIEGLRRGAAIRVEQTGSSSGC